MLLSIQSPITKKFHHDVNHDMAILENEMGSNQFPSLLSYLSLMDKDAIQFYFSESRNSHRFSNVDVVDDNQEIAASNYVTPSKSKTLISQLPRKSPLNQVTNSSNETSILKPNGERIKAAQHKSLFMIDVTSNLGQRLSIFKKHSYCMNRHDGSPYSDNDSVSEIDLDNNSSRTRSCQQPCLITYKKKKNENYHCHKYKFTKKDNKEFLKTLSSGLNARSRKLLKLVKPCELVLRKMKHSEINKILYHVDNYNLLKTLMGNYFCNNPCLALKLKHDLNNSKYSHPLRNKNKISNLFEIENKPKDVLNSHILKEKYPFNDANNPCITTTIQSRLFNGIPSVKDNLKKCFFKCNLCDDRFMINIQMMEEVISEHFISKHKIKKENFFNSNTFNGFPPCSDKFYLFSTEPIESSNFAEIPETNSVIPNEKCLFKCKICFKKVIFHSNSVQPVLEHMSLKHNITKCEVNSGSFRDGLVHIINCSSS